MSNQRSATSTPAQIAASRENGKKSRGPRTEAGKARAKMNALKQGWCCPSFRESMLPLGENPGEFDRLYHDLLEAYQPTDALGAKLVEDLEKLYWRQARLERGRDGVLRRELELLELEQMRHRQEIAHDSFDAGAAEIGFMGLRRALDCPAKFKQTLAYLETLLGCVEQRNFSADTESLFDVLYGKHPTWRGGTIIRLFRCLAHPADSGAPLDESAYAELRKLLLEEIRSVHEESALYQREHVEISAAARDARLAPMGKPWTWMLRQENALDRAIDRKVRMLIAYKRCIETNGTGAGEPGNGRKAEPSGSPAPGQNPSPRTARVGARLKPAPPDRQKQVTLKMKERTQQVTENKAAGSENEPENEPEISPHAPNLGAHEPRRNPRSGFGVRGQGWVARDRAWQIED